MKTAITAINRQRLKDLIDEVPTGYILEIKEPKRTLNQNALIHPVVKQIQDYMEGHGAPARSKEWWRYYLLGKWNGSEITPDPDPDAKGSFVVINRHAGTSGLSKAEASEFIEFLYAFGCNIGVKFTA